MRGRPGGAEAGAGDSERRKSGRGESESERRAEETRATSVRPGTAARTAGRGVCELLAPRPNPRVSLPIGWPHPRKGGTGTKGETDGGEGRATRGDPKAERPTLPRMVGIVGAGD